MRKIWITIIIFILLSLQVRAFYCNDEVIDQSTPFGTNGWNCGLWNIYLAQSFKPKLPILSKVEIGLFKVGNPDGNITISIKEKLNGEELISKTISIDVVPSINNADWVEFDFDNIDVVPNKKYFIVFTMNNGERPDNLNNIVCWVHSLWNPYWRGMPWQYGQFGEKQFWLPTIFLQIKFPDATFRTWGIER